MSDLPPLIKSRYVHAGLRFSEELDLVYEDIYRLDEHDKICSKNIPIKSSLANKVLLGQVFIGEFSEDGMIAEKDKFQTKGIYHDDALVLEWYLKQSKALSTLKEKKSSTSEINELACRLKKENMAYKALKENRDYEGMETLEALILHALRA